jgi:two-component system nitrate/nitrite response regulator NarL
MTKIRLVVVDDHALFRAGLISLLSEMPDFQVVGEADDGKKALDLVRTLQPDVLLLDVNMPGMGGVETVRALREMPVEQQCQILMLTISKSDEDLLGAITAGADGYLLKNVEPDELSRGIKFVHQGMSVLSPQITRQVMNATVDLERRLGVENVLSEREMDVLKCLSNGLTTSRIADELYISDNTVKTHVRHILEKLEASNRAEAVSKAVQMGIINVG